MRYTETLTVAVTLDRAAPVPLARQLAGRLGAAVHDGSLAPGARMPSTRTLAQLLGVSRGVASEAYDLLAAQGVLRSRTGSGTYVAGPDRTVRRRPAADAGTVADLRPGLPSAEVFPLAAWRAAWRRAGHRIPPVPPPLGVPELREALSEHLLRTRGYPPGGHTVVITSGLGASLRLLLDVLDAGPSAVAVEEPADPVLWQAIDHPVPLDGLPPSRRIAVTAPAGHTVAGRPLSLGARRELTDWASAPGRRLVEVACDAVFRTPDPLPERTCVIGSFAGLFTPALRLGYALVPPDLLGRVTARLGEPPSAIDQLAAAHLLSGDTARPLMHRIGRLHARQRGIVAAVLGRLPAGFVLSGLEAAGTAILRLPERLPADVAQAALAAAGVRVETLSRYCFSTGADSSGLVLGYGHSADDELRAGLTALTTVLTREAARRPLACSVC